MRNITIHNIPKFFTLTVLLFSSALAFSQDSRINQGNKDFEKLGYLDAAKIYERVANNGFRSEEILRRLGDSYYFLGRYKDASNWYGQLFALNQSQPNSYNLRYAQTLKAIDQPTISEKYYQTFLSNLPLSKQEYDSVEIYQMMIEENSGRYELEKLPINSKSVDFGVNFMGEDHIVFASSREKGVLQKRVSSWDGLPYLDLYESKVSGDSLYSEPKKLSGKLNSKYHESTAVFTKDGQTVYFTRTMTRSGDELLHLKIYRSTLQEGQWSEVEELNINGDNYNTAHPALNKSEDKLYFASDRPEGEGQTDLYYASIHNDGTLGKPVNLGKKINTPGRESFPFVNNSDELYFSSDGHYGLGGYDVFYVKLKGNGYEGNLLNVGKPINSSFDDVCYVVKNNKGYLSSNREDAYGRDNIYKFTELEPIKDTSFKSRLHGKVVNRKTGEPIEGAKIIVSDVDNHVVETITTKNDGLYKSDVSYLEDYLLNVTKVGFTGSDAFSKGKQKDREFDFELEPSGQALVSGTNIAEALNIKEIYFDYNKWNINYKAEIDLQKIVEVLKSHPEINIDIKSHTDSRGNDSYNLWLSQKRALSTLDYLVAHGVKRQSLTARGYGETELINACGNRIDCTEEMHQENRRSEFIIVNK